MHMYLNIYDHFFKLKLNFYVMLDARSEISLLAVAGAMAVA